MLLTVKSNQKTLYRQIGAQFQGKRHIPFAAMDFEKRHGRHTTWELSAKEAPEHIKANWPGSAWIVEMTTMTTTRKGTRKAACHRFITSIRTTPEAPGLIQSMWRALPAGCRHRVRWLRSSLVRARHRNCCNRSRSDHLPQGDP